MTTTIKMIGDNQIMPSGGLVDGIDVGTAVPAAAAAAAAAQTAADTHASRHVGGGADAIADAVPAGASGLMSGANATKLAGISAGADVTAASAHVASTSNPHSVTAAQVGCPPNARTVTAGAGLTGGGDLSADRSFACDFGTGAGKVCEGNDSRLSDARALAAGADKTKLDGIAEGARSVSWNWGAQVATAVTAARYYIRTGAAPASTIGGGEYSCPVAGTRTVTLAVTAGTALVTDSVTYTLMINGVASALAVTLAAGATSVSGSASLTLAVGDRVNVRIVQSATESGAAMNHAACVTA